MMNLVDEMWKQPEPSSEAVHIMCHHVRKIIYNSSNGEKGGGLCENCEGWKDYPEEKSRSARACYIRAEETLKYAMAILKQEGWKAPDA